MELYLRGNKSLKSGSDQHDHCYTLVGNELLRDKITTEELLRTLMNVHPNPYYRLVHIANCDADQVDIILVPGTSLTDLLDFAALVSRTWDRLILTRTNGASQQSPRTMVSPVS